ncbi:MAG: pyridoxal phosphate-dependent aminotransferase [Holophagaceae bacterium]|nr:pyridoxal phosphate-dependent aminotransferase [Holophagaceae bacterium]
MDLQYAAVMLRQMRISNRLPASLLPTAFSMLVEARREAPEFLDLTVSNPTQCGFDFAEGAWTPALASEEVLRYKADPCGSLPARVAIATHHGCGVHPEDILLTASTSEAYSWLFKLLCDPGDQVLVPSPSYPLFEHLAALEGIETVNISAYFHERWCSDITALESACGPRTRAIVVVNPNNPSGQFLSIGEWKDLAALCATRDLALLVDEVFADFALEPAVDSLRTALLDGDPPCPVFVLSGLSKVALLPQVKLGWILLRGKARACLEPLAFLADQYLSVSASAQAVAATALLAAPARRTKVLDRAHDNLICLDEFLKEYPHLSRLPVEGGWSVLLRRPVYHGADDVACAKRLLEETSVLVHPGSFFDLPMEGYLVLSLLTPPRNFREGLSRILPRLPVD